MVRNSLTSNDFTNFVPTTKDFVRNFNLFMQNKPKHQKSQVGLSGVLTSDYEKRTLGERGKNKPKTKPNKPNSNPT